MSTLVFIMSMFAIAKIEATPSHHTKNLRKRATTTEKKTTERRTTERRTTERKTTERRTTTKKAATTTKKTATTKKAATTTPRALSSTTSSINPTTTATVTIDTTTTATTTSSSSSSSSTLDGLTVSSNPNTTAASAATPTTASTLSTSQKGGISSGAIAGIAVAAAAIVAGLIAFLVIRKRQKQRSNDNPRVSKTHLGQEPNTMYTSTPPPPPQPAMTESYYAPYTSYDMDPPTHVVPYNTPIIIQQDEKDIAHPIEPSTPITQYNQDPSVLYEQQKAIYEGTSPTLTGGLSPPPPSSTQPLGIFTVIATYTPTLSDELQILVGDQVEILVEYDDGWCQGVNLSRGHTKGVFPKHCVNMETAVQTPSSSPQPPQQPVGAKRASSMYIPK